MISKLNNLDTISLTSELFAAIKNNNIRKVHRHVQLFSRNTRFNMGRTMLHVAAFFNRHHIVDVLTQDYNIVDNIKDYQGKTALIVAAKKGHLSIVQRLTTDFNINLQDNRGMTPLLEGYKNNHLEICKCLIVLGADTTKVSYGGFFIPDHVIWRLRGQMPTPVDILFARQGQIQRNITIARNTIITPQIEYTRTRTATIPVDVPPHFKNEFVEMAIALKKECPICLDCLEKDKTIFTTCSHLLCSSCFGNERLTTCPLCRKDIK